MTIAYTSLLSEVAWADSPVLAYAAVLPCQKLYDWLFSTLKATRHIASNNPYKAFIDQYADPKNHNVTRILEAFLDRHAEGRLDKTLQTRAQYFYSTAMRYEAEFFEQGLEVFGDEVGGGNDSAVVSAALPCGRRHGRCRNGVGVPMKANHLQLAVDHRRTGVGFKGVGDAADRGAPSQVEKLLVVTICSLVALCSFWLLTRARSTSLRLCRAQVARRNAPLMSVV